MSCLRRRSESGGVYFNQTELVIVGTTERRTKALSEGGLERVRLIFLFNKKKEHFPFLIFYINTTGSRYCSFSSIIFTFYIEVFIVGALLLPVKTSHWRASKPAVSHSAWGSDKATDESASGPQIHVWFCPIKKSSLHFLELKLALNSPLKEEVKLIFWEFAYLLCGWELRWEDQHSSRVCQLNLVFVYLYVNLKDRRIRWHRSSPLTLFDI